MIKLNLIVIRTKTLESTVQWYSKTFDLAFAAEKHDDGVLHYSAQLSDGMIEIYPTKQSASKITFGIAVDRICFEQVVLRERYRIIGEGLILIKDYDGNSIIVNFTPQTA